MRPKPIYVVDIMGDIVSKVNTAVIAELQAFDSMITKVNYEYGTYEEITKVLTLMSQQTDLQYQRYPLWALIMSFPEQHGQQVGIDGLEELNIIIARRSNNTDRTPARYEKNFKPVLYPVYLETLNQIDLDKRFLTQGVSMMPHTKIDYPYYNADDKANAFGDYVDAIQIKIKLKINLKNC